MSDDLTRLREIAAAATPGPWTVEYAGDLGDKSAIIECARWRGMLNTISLGEDHATAEFIATFDPPTVTALLDRAERAEKEYAEAAFAVTQLAALRAAVTAKAESCEREAAHWTDQAEARSGDNRSNCYALASKYSSQAADLRALLTDEGDNQ